jgi:glycosyltransferase 2 family protein
MTAATSAPLNFPRREVRHARVRASPTQPPGPGVRRWLWPWVRLGTGVVVIGVLVRQLGPGPFIGAVSGIDGWSLVAGAGIAFLTTLCCAWRWSLVAGQLGVAVSTRTALGACYRSQFLNVATPGGVAGDVVRGLRHGRDVGDTSRALRSVAWERLVGQLVQAALAVPLLLLLPSPVRAVLPRFVVPLLLVAVVAVCGILLLRRVRPGPSSLWSRARRAAAGDLRAALVSRHTLPRLVAASALAVGGHVLTFLIAARTAGSTAPSWQLAPLALIVLLAAALPTNLAGWGPREGVAAWAFGASGAGAELGVATAVVFGLMAVVASLPGAVLLLLSRPRAAGRVDGHHGDLAGA